MPDFCASLRLSSNFFFFFWRAQLCATHANLSECKLTGHKELTLGQLDCAPVARVQLVELQLGCFSPAPAATCCCFNNCCCCLFKESLGLGSRKLNHREANLIIFVILPRSFGRDFAPLWRKFAPSLAPPLLPAACWLLRSLAFGLCFCFGGGGGGGRD